MKSLKQKVLENLEANGYCSSQLKDLNPIIINTIEATKQALDIDNVSNKMKLLIEKDNYIEVTNNFIDKDSRMLVFGRGTHIHDMAIIPKWRFYALILTADKDVLKAIDYKKVRKLAKEGKL